MYDNERINDLDDDRREADRARDAALVARAQHGDDNAFAQLYEAWFDRVFGVARHIVRNDEAAADATQDAFMSAWRNLAGLDNPGAFGGWILRIARNKALNQIGRDARTRSVDQEQLSMIERTASSPTSAPPGFGSQLCASSDPGALVADAQIRDLVHDVADSLGERDREVLDLQLRYGLSPAEVGEVLGINRNAANQLCHRVRNRFSHAFRARMVWNSSRHTCVELQNLLQRSGITEFGAPAIAIITEHVSQCETCDDKQRIGVAPVALFSALPIATAPALLKSRVTKQLSASGVPVATRPAAVGAPRRIHPFVVGIAATIAVALFIAGLIMLTGGQETKLARISATPPTTSHQSAAGPHPTTTIQALARTVPSGGTTTSQPQPHVVPPHPPRRPATSTTTTTEVPKPVVEQFVLSSNATRPATFAMTDAPVLTWSVVNAHDVAVWLHFDDGVHGDQRLRAISHDAQGAQAICPGTLVNPTTCSSPAGRYSFELVVEPQLASPIQERPSFDVEPPVIG